MKEPVSITEWLAFCKDWRERKGFRTEWNNFAEKCMLIVTEISEAVEEHRKRNRRPHMSIDTKARYNITIELADAMIRILDLAGSLELDLESAMREKMAINETRPMLHGKRY